MALSDYFQRLSRIDRLISLKATGSPKELANKIGISERSVYDDIQNLKKRFGCPIAYSKTKRSYYYTKEGRIEIGFSPTPPPIDIN